VMAVLFGGWLTMATVAEHQGNPAVAAAGVTEQPDGNMEGKEVRFGIASTALFATMTTDASCGAVNGMHDSFTPVGGMVPLVNILCDEVIFGGVGAGLFGILMYAVIAVFLGGLMVGRTPEYVGKKIEKYEVRMAVIALLILFANVVVWAGLGAHNPASPHQMNNGGAHGFSELFYMYASQTGNNGSAFAGFTGNTRYFNVTGGLAMLVGRFLMIIPLLAMAGSLVRKRSIPESAGTLATHSATFVFLLASVVLIVGALEHFPALSLGPIIEQFQMLAGSLT